MRDALALLDAYVALHNRGVETGDFRPMLALFAADAEMAFVGLDFPTLVGIEEIATAFRDAPPDDALALLDAAASEDGSAEAVFGWRSDPPPFAGTIRIEPRGGKIRRLTVTVSS